MGLKDVFVCVKKLMIGTHLKLIDAGGAGRVGLINNTCIQALSE